MLASRGMGDISPSKMPKAVKKARRDDTDFTQYAAGGEIKAKKPGKMSPQQARFLEMIKGKK
jgi:hypothetical protein